MNQRQLVAVLTQELEKVEERSSGYRTAVRDALINIITAEREHRVRRTYIQQAINDQCQAVGDFLAKSMRPPAQSAKHE